MRFTPQVRQLSWMLRRPIAHRGLHAIGEGRAENSESAFAAAMSADYAIECDVQLSADGRAVVFHDDTLDRMTGGREPVKMRPVRDLQKLAIGGTQDRIQALDELLEQVSGKTPLIIEIKSHWNNDPSLALATLDATKSYSGPYALMSFDPAIVRLLAEVAPHTVRGIVADRVHGHYYSPLSLARRREMRTFEHLSETRPHFVSFDCNGLPFEPVQRIREAGYPVITWTITSEAMAAHARRYSDQITFEDFLPA